jgi:tetratricopeptide (TPR) repeat protein
MIERLLAAEDALARGDLDVAERLFTQVADADARNAIAVVGLARVAAERGKGDEAIATLRRALEIDPDEAAALRLLRRYEAEPMMPAIVEAPVPAPRTIEPPQVGPPQVEPPQVEPAVVAPGAVEPSAVEAGGAVPKRPAPGAVDRPPGPIATARSKRPSLLVRIRRWLGLPGGHG